MKKNKSTEKRETWKLLGVALGVVLLMAAVGCINITIKTAGPTQTAAQEKSQPIGDDSGPFVPVQAAPLGGSPMTICGNAVPGTKVLFFNPLSTQRPPAGFTGFRGTVVNLNTGLPISNTDYYLQYFVNSAVNGCCTIATGAEVTCSVTAGLPYRFTAFFRTGIVPPPSDHQIQLQGIWTQ